MVVKKKKKSRLFSKPLMHIYTLATTLKPLTSEAKHINHFSVKSFDLTRTPCQNNGNQWAPWRTPMAVVSCNRIKHNLFILFTWSKMS